MKGFVIRANGLAEAVDFPQTSVESRLGWYYKLLGCDCIDIVRPYGMEEIAKENGLEAYIGKFCLIVDDEGLLKDEPQVNVLASLLYGTDTHGQPLCGDVLVAKNEETDEGVDTVGMTDTDIESLEVAIQALVERHNERVRGNS